SEPQDLLEHRRTRNLLNALIDVEEEGVEDLDEEEVLSMHKKAMFCVECGVCVGRCRKNALYFEDGVKIDTERCVHCGRCLGECPVTSYDARVKESS
ncbi:MAG: 4Fe-4S binding protein, partial [Candidatus Natronoplasma sp.]